MKFVRKREDDGAANSGDETPQCEHVTLIPSWDRPEDMGQDDKVSLFRCEACGAEFTLDAAEHLKATERARVLRRLAS